MARQLAAGPSQFDAKIGVASKVFGNYKSVSRVMTPKAENCRQSALILASAVWPEQYCRQFNADAGLRCDWSNSL
jgi:hypothetical protein